MGRIISFFKRHKKETIFLIIGCLLTLAGDFVLSRINNSQINKSNILNIGVDIFKDKDTLLLAYLRKEVEVEFISGKKEEMLEFITRLENAIKQPKHSILMIGFVHENNSTKVIEDALVTAISGKASDSDYTDKNGLFYLLLQQDVGQENEITDLSVSKNGYTTNSFSLTPKNDSKIDAKHSISLTKKE